MKKLEPIKRVDKTRRKGEQNKNNYEKKIQDQSFCQFFLFKSLDFQKKYQENEMVIYIKLFYKV